MAEGKNPIVMPQVIGIHCRAVGHGTMVRIVEKQSIVRVMRSMFADALDQSVIIPFMDQYDVRAVECLIQVQRCEVILDAAKVRKSGVEFVYRSLTVLCHQILAAQGEAREVADEEQRRQLLRQAAKKHKVPVAYLEARIIEWKQALQYPEDLEEADAPAAAAFNTLGFCFNTSSMSRGHT